MMNDGLEFVCAESSGVPILLCPAEITQYWTGINEPSSERVIEAEFDLNGPEGVHVDYDRACDAASDYINTISIGPGSALIFGDEIPSMYWLNAEDFDGGYLLTWLYLKEGELPDLRDFIKALPIGFFTEVNHTAVCSTDGFLLFPSTNAPMDGEYFQFVKIACPEGVYGAALGLYETPDTSIRVIKIQRQDY